MIGLALTGIAYQNWRVTGDPLKLPYVEAAEQTQASPAFLWSKIRRDIPYLDPFLAARLAEKEWQVWLFYLGPSLTLRFLFGPRLWADRRLLRLWPFAACAMLTGMIESWYFPHYIAPYTAVFAAFAVQALRHLNASQGRGYARFAATIPAVVCVTVAAGAGLAVTPNGVPIHLGLRRVGVARRPGPGRDSR